MKINWSPTNVTDFCKLEIKDMRKLKRIQLFYFWTKLDDILSQIAQSPETGEDQVLDHHMTFLNQKKKKKKK